MKDSIHPKYGHVTIQCACGNTIETSSTVQGRIQVDVCSACHPHFTGKQKLMDTAGRIDRFKKKYGDKVNITVPKKVKKAAEPAATLETSASKLKFKKEEKIKSEQEKTAAGPKE